MKHGREATALFEQRGRTVIRVWECELKWKNRRALTESRIVCPKQYTKNILPTKNRTEDILFS